MKIWENEKYISKRAGAADNRTCQFSCKSCTWEAEDEEGQKYFQNETKGESMWEHPSQVFLPIQAMYLELCGYSRLFDVFPINSDIDITMSWSLGWTWSGL